MCNRRHETLKNSALVSVAAVSDVCLHTSVNFPSLLCQNDDCEQIVGNFKRQISFIPFFIRWLNRLLVSLLLVHKCKTSYCTVRTANWLTFEEEQASLFLRTTHPEQPSIMCASVLQFVLRAVSAQRVPKLLLEQRKCGKFHRDAAYRGKAFSRGCVQNAMETFFFPHVKPLKHSSILCV